MELVYVLVLEAKFCGFESVLGHHIKTLCSSYTGTTAKLPMKPVEGRTCQEEEGYRGFKRRREFLYGIG